MSSNHPTVTKPQPRQWAFMRFVRREQYKWMQMIQARKDKELKRDRDPG